MEKKENKISSDQFYDIITGGEISWQAIIYDLIKTEQLDPWDMDISILAERYLEIIRQLEEANFLVSSKVLLACALLLRLKSEILTNRYIRTLDEAIYGKKEEKKYILERIELDEDELPILIPRTPMPRFKKVTLKELMFALNKAMETEGRRIRREISTKQAEKRILSICPSENRISLKNRVDGILDKIKKHLEEFSLAETTFHRIAPNRQEKLVMFLPLLHLDNNEKIFMRQQENFKDIFINLEKQQLIEELEFSEEFIEDISKGEILEGDRREKEIEFNEGDSP